MYDNWKKSNKKMRMLMVFTLFFAAVLFIIFFFELVPLADELAKGSSMTPADMKLYGEIFSICILILTLGALVRKIKEDPEKVFIKSLRRYANTTQNPEAALGRLKKTWESGEQLRDWCRMDEEYIIVCINGPCYANVIPVREVVWAYKTVTRVNAVIKTDTSLMVRYANQKGGSISISEQTVDYILQQFMEKHPDIVVGHNREVEKLYLKKDMAGLKEYARQQRAGIL
ncbi:MAG: hypothetical protein LUK37_01570 [Clostridia bacterium]|nr:hypothetical protein [Clostridia bacterium]